MNLNIPTDDRESWPKVGYINVSDMKMSYQLVDNLRAYGIAAEPARTPYVKGVTIDVRHMEQFADRRALTDAALSLRDTEILALAYACTSGSFVKGARGDLKMREWMAAAAELDYRRVTTTTSALVSAIRACEDPPATPPAEAEKLFVAIASPYTEPMTAPLPDYFSEVGIETVKMVCYGAERDIHKIPANTRRALVRNVADQARVIVFPCTNVGWEWDETARLEEEFGIIVLQSNEATCWDLAGLVGKGPGDIDRPGTLFSREFYGNPILP